MPAIEFFLRDERTFLKELLDGEDLPPDAFKRVLKRLDDVSLSLGEGGFWPEESER